MGDFIDFIINTVLISIPEESFMVAFTLIFLGKVEYLNFKRQNVIKFLIPVVATAATTSFIRIILHSGMSYIPFLAVLMIAGLIILIYKITSFKKIMQCLACTIAGLIIPVLLQIIYVPVSMSIMQLTMDDIHKVSLGVVCFTLPERVLEFLIVAVLFSKKKNLLRVNPFRLIFSNRTMSVIFISSLILNLIFVYVFTSAVYTQKILINLSILTQLFAVMIVFIIPVVNMSAIIGVIYVLAIREKKKRMYIVEETKAVSALISLLSRSGNYKQIQEELTDFNKQMREIDMRK